MENKQKIIDEINRTKEYLANLEKVSKEWKEEYRAKVEELNEFEEKLLHKEQECEELKEDRERWKSNFNGKVSAIEELLQKFDQLNAEKESLKESLKMFSSTLDWALKSQVKLYKRQIDSSVPDDWEYEEVLVLVEQYIEKLKQTLAEIKEIAEGMHDLWINKTPYTDMDNLVKHILECELNRIRYKLDEISECVVKNE